MAKDEVPEPEDGDSEEGEAPPPSGKKKLILLAAVGVVVLLVGGGAAAFFLGAFDSLLGVAEEDEASVALPTPSVYYEFPQLVVDLKATKKRRRTEYIKLKVVVEVAGEEGLNRLEEVELKVVDGFQTYIRGLTRGELSGSAGTEALRAAFLDIVNAAMEPDLARGVLFREILLQ